MGLYKDGATKCSSLSGWSATGKDKTFTMNRILFCALGLILISCPAMSFGYQQDTGIVEELAAIHNKYRRIIAHTNERASNMKKLIWDKNLEQEATKKATCDNINTLLKPRELSSIVMDLMEVPPSYGTNADLVSLKRSLNSIVRKWYMEGRNYIPLFNMCQPGKECKRYKQLAAAEAERIGCAVNPFCKRGKSGSLFIVCLYSPGIESRLDPGDTLFSPGQVCTKCPKETPFCDAGLCVGCHGNPRYCDCRKTCARNINGEGVLNRTSCTCDCTYGHGPNCDEPCEQSEMYADYYDPCGEITQADCELSNPDRALLMEFCPTACACRPMPKQVLNR